MITFNGHGLCIADRGFSSAEVDSQGIRMRFEDGSSVWLSKVLVAHAHALIKFDREQEAQRAAQRQGTEQETKR